MKGIVLNILNRPWKEIFDLPPFEKVKEEDFLPALKEAILLATKNLEKIANIFYGRPFCENDVSVLDFYISYFFESIC